MVGVPAIDCSTIEKPPFYAPVRGLTRCASRLWSANRLHSSLTVDGVRLSVAGVFVVTSPFRFTVNHNQPDLHGRSSGTAAVAATPALLNPLSPGRHTVIAENQYRGLPIERSTYVITVR